MKAIDAAAAARAKAKKKAAAAAKKAGDGAAPPQTRRLTGKTTVTATPAPVATVAATPAPVATLAPSPLAAASVGYDDLIAWDKAFGTGDKKNERPFHESRLPRDEKKMHGGRPLLGASVYARARGLQSGIRGV